MVSEPGSENISAKVLACRAAKIDVSEFVAGQPVPASMIPGTCDQVIQVICVVLFQNLIGLDRTVKVFLIPPSRDMHDRNRRLFELTNQRLLLPELIVIRMGHEVVPCRQLFVKVLFIRIRKRAESQIPLVGVVAVELKICEDVRSLELIRILKTIAQ